VRRFGSKTIRGNEKSYSTFQRDHTIPTGGAAGMVYFQESYHTGLSGPDGWLRRRLRAAAQTEETTRIRTEQGWQ